MLFPGWSRLQLNPNLSFLKGNRPAMIDRQIRKWRRLIEYEQSRIAGWTQTLQNPKSARQAANLRALIRSSERAIRYAQERLRGLEAERAKRFGSPPNKD